MTGDGLTKEGGCRCGRVRLKVTKRPLLTMACHCKGCQRMSSSAFSLSAAIPTDGFEVTQGRACHRRAARRVQALFLRPLHELDVHPAGRHRLVRQFAPDHARRRQLVDAVHGDLDSEKLPWAATSAVHSYEALPPMDAYEGLIKEYAERVDG